MNINTNFDRKGINDAPRTTTLEQSAAWAKGYNECLVKTNAKGLLAICEKLLLARDESELNLSDIEVRELTEAIEKGKSQESSNTKTA